MISDALVVIMAVLAVITFIWCFHMENGKDDKDKKEM